ncbi:hypothetical protein H0H87_012836 [Tephrocybe sp. NHM501043]|nr:hypothetical protein H0H87_012836 [Tephrocybe sp. NHM501043]
MGNLSSYTTMQFFAAVLTAIALAAPILATPTALRTVEKFSGEKTGKFIVELKEGASKINVLASLNANVTHDWSLIHGFAGKYYVIAY